MPTHNWDEPFVLYSNWQTDIQSAGSVKESRAAKTDRPSRVAEPVALTDTVAKGRLASIYISRLGQAKGMFPLLCDEVTTTNADDTTFSGDFAYRRFYAGGRAAISTADNSSFEYGVIASISDTELSLTEALTASFPAGSKISPVMEIYLTLETELEPKTDSVISVPFSVEEVVGGTAIPASSESYTAYPTLPEYYDWGDVRKKLLTQGNSATLNTAKYFNTFSAYPLQSYSIPMILERDEFWDICQLFDSVKGKCKSFWATSPTSDFTTTALTTGSITVTSVGPESAWDEVKALAIVKTNGTVVIGIVGSVARGAGLDVVTLSNTIPPITLAEIRRTSLGVLSRFTSDEMKESWLTPSVVEMTMEITEALDI
jgi:hypothetical protein